MNRRDLLLAGAAFALVPSAAPAGEGDWVFLGQRQVRWLSDHDSIRVGVADARFDHIRFQVSGNGIFIQDMDVVYSNGMQDHIVTQWHLREGSKSRIINLRGGNRYIRRVEFRYRRPGDFDGPATLQLFGQR
jgi:hypothetical protein